MATVLVTAAGAPGCPRLIRALREAGPRGRRHRRQPALGGSRLCDRFAVVPRGDAPEFIPAMRAAAADLGADVVFPTSSSEILAWAQARDDFGLPVLAGPADGVEAASDKAETFRVAERAGVPHPRTIEVRRPGRVRRRRARAGLPAAAGRHEAARRPRARAGSASSTRRADRRHWLLESRPGEDAARRLEDVLDLLGPGRVPRLHRAGVPGRARGDRRRDLPRRRAAPAR